MHLTLETTWPSCKHKTSGYLNTHSKTVTPSWHRDAHTSQNLHIPAERKSNGFGCRIKVQKLGDCSVFGAHCVTPAE